MDHLLFLDDSAESRWMSIYAARRRSSEKLAVLKSAIYDGVPLVAPETPLVVYGSLARHEFQDGSDLDWTLLVDGAVDPGHAESAKVVGARLHDHGFLAPGATGTFGNLTFSHDLVHYIGGSSDSNINTTRRILLMLESIDASNGIVHERVLTSILNRYIEQDVPLGARKAHIPRFLLNDIVRFWRTMAVDYATKIWERNSDGWALRNVKLRTSRKLLYVKGLLVCFAYALQHADDDGDLPVQAETIAELQQLVSLTPIECLAKVASENGLASEAKLIVDSYEEFLTLMAKNGNRRHLKQLAYAEASGDYVFEAFRSTSRDFQARLNRLFFGENEKLRNLAQEYGLF